MKESIYITTTLPYVNADPHIGFAAELIRADISARYFRQKGYEVILNTGTDEHGGKIEQAAKKLNQDPQTYVDGMAKNYETLPVTLGVDQTNFHFIRTSSEAHKAAAQAFWQKVFDNGYIYKKTYQAKYCVGCELFKTDSELENGQCPIHPTYQIQLVDEENYFFKQSAFADKLTAYYNERPDFVIPDWRFNEARAFVAGGLEDFSISREKSKLTWGVPVPGDDSQVMYVWFDALVNYISTLGWPDEKGDFAEFWPGIQCCGKDNLRQQSIMWQSMLLAAGLPLSKNIIVNGFIVDDQGQKMSKSIGNVISPETVLEKLGTEGFRYFVFRHLNCFEDSKVGLEIMIDNYNTGLSNGLGNLVSRVLKMAENYEIKGESVTPGWLPGVEDLYQSFDQNKVAGIIYEAIGNLDRQIQSEEPFKVYKTDPQKAKEMVANYLPQLADIAYSLMPVLPQTATTILDLIKEGKSPTAPLFPRL